MSPFLLLLLLPLLAVTTAQEAGLRPARGAADLDPSDSSLHYAYGNDYGYHANPYGGHAGGYEHTYSHHVEDGYHGHGHHGYENHQAYGYGHHDLGHHFVGHHAVGPHSGPGFGPHLEAGHHAGRAYGYDLVGPYNHHDGPYGPFGFYANFYHH